jgi:hypothetical protein
MNQSASAPVHLADSAPPFVRAGLDPGTHGNRKASAVRGWQGQAPLDPGKVEERPSRAQAIRQSPTTALGGLNSYCRKNWAPDPS